MDEFIQSNEYDIKNIELDENIELDKTADNDYIYKYIESLGFVRKD